MIKGSMHVYTRIMNHPFIEHWVFRVSLCLLLAISHLGLRAQNGNDAISLEVTVNNIRSDMGTLVLCLTDNASDFLKRCAKKKMIQVTARGSLHVFFEDLPTGRYAISIFHDTNANTALDKKLFGIPKEDFGFSNNPRLGFGPPAFEDCVFVHHKDRPSLFIDLKHIM